MSGNLSTSSMGCFTVTKVSENTIKWLGDFWAISYGKLFLWIAQKGYLYQIAPRDFEYAHFNRPTNYLSTQCDTIRLRPLGSNSTKSFWMFY